MKGAKEMKVELNIDKKFGETIVTISTNKVNDEIQNLVNYIENKEDYFIGVLGGKVRLLNKTFWITLVPALALLL